MSQPPKEWSMIPLADTCELFTDGNWIESKDQSSNGIRLIQTGNVGSGGFKDRREKARWISSETFTRLKCQEIIPGDCLVSRLPDPVGRSCLIPETGDKMITAVDCSILRFDTSILLSDFFNYYSQSKTYHANVESKCTGATRKRISRKNLGITPIPTPPLPEQKRIVAILDEMFAGITQAVANAEKNLANARDLFESYLNNVFTQKGEGWVEKRLSDVCLIKHGFAFKSQYFSTEGDYIVLTPGSFYENGGFRDQGKKTKYYLGEIPDGYILNEGDFLIAMTEQAAGLLGSSLIVPQSNRFLHNQRLGFVQVADGMSWDSSFFHHQFNTQSFRNAVQTTASGVKVRHTSPTKLGAISITYPPELSEQKRIASVLNKMKSKVQHLETIYQQKLTALAELKQSILQKAFAGQLTRRS